MLETKTVTNGPIAVQVQGVCHDTLPWLISVSLDVGSVNETARDLLELHKLTTEDLRHTATIIWQFAIAIVTLEGGAVGLALHAGFDTVAGIVIAAAGLALSCLFSIMLVRQAAERK